jgi:hypothetical protein
MYPWTHRAINQAGFIRRELTDRNVFRVVGDSYRTLSFSQNLWATHLLDQFNEDIDHLLSPALFSEPAQVIGDRFPRDLNGAFLSLDEFLYWDDNPSPSLVFGIPVRAYRSLQAVHSGDRNLDYPVGLPTTTLLPIYFRLDELFDGLATIIDDLGKDKGSPYLAYFHLWGVHNPYNPHERFFEKFLDGWAPPEKPRHELGGSEPEDALARQRSRYDEYVASVDYEFGRLLDHMERDGILEDSYVILTADHGESFERGTLGHTTPLLFQPLVRIPLLISTPGQRERIDIHTPTNNVDILPTLASIAGQSIPAWCEGEVLPWTAEGGNHARSSFTVEAKSSPPFRPMETSSVAMVKGRYKLVGYFSSDYNFYELYDLASDPNELISLIEDLDTVAKPMKEELLYRFSRANAPYTGK